MTQRSPIDRPAGSRPQRIAAHDAVEHELGDDVGQEIKTTLAALMPWGISILFHAALVVLAFFLVWQTIIKVDDQQPVVPQLATTPSITSMKPMKKSETNPDAGAAAMVPIITPVDVQTPVTPGAGQPTPHVFEPGHSHGIDGLADGPGSGPTGPGPITLEPGGNASKIVYIIDASGSMVDVLPFVINELKGTIARLGPDEYGNPKEVTILLFSGDGVAEVPGGGGVRGLRELDDRYKEQISEWATLENHRYNVGGSGSAHVGDALARGLSYKPHVVFLLSDNLTGGGQGASQHELFQDDLMQLIKDHNKATPSARIHTLQFLYEDPLVRAGLPGTLQRIADDTGGTYKFISQRDLNLR